MNSLTMADRLLLAARRPLALLVLAAMIATAATAHWWAMPVGVVAYGLMVWFAAGDPILTAAPAEKPRLERITSRTFQAQLESIDRTRREIGRSVAMSPASLQRLLQPIADQAEEVFVQANGLAGKGQIIEQYLQGTNPQQVQGQILGLDQRIAGTSDAYTRDQLIETRAALIDRQQNAQALETYYNRVMAQLQNISANLENVQAETVRLRASESATASTTSTAVADQLRDMNADMDAFQHVLEGALSQSGAM